MRLSARKGGMGGGRGRWTAGDIVEFRMGPANRAVADVQTCTGDHGFEIIETARERVFLHHDAAPREEESTHMSVNALVESPVLVQPNQFGAVWAARGPFAIVGRIADNQVKSRISRHSAQSVRTNNADPVCQAVFGNRFPATLQTMIIDIAQGQLLTLRSGEQPESNETWPTAKLHGEGAAKFLSGNVVQKVLTKATAASVELSLKIDFDTENIEYIHLTAPFVRQDHVGIMYGIFAWVNSRLFLVA